MRDRPPPTSVPGTPGDQNDDRGILIPVLVLLGIGAALALVGLQVFAWF